MERERLLALGVDEAVIDEIMADYDSVREEYEGKIKSLSREKDIELCLMESGARNMRAVRALIEEGDDYKEQIENLKKGEGTRFLFDGGKSFLPHRSGEKLPDTTFGEMELKLKMAREKKNTVEAIRIKQMAARMGITLI